MLTLYIINTHHKEKNTADIYYTLSGLWKEGRMVQNIAEINEDTKDTDWYLVLFDHEKISVDLRNAIATIIKMDPPFDVFIFMEKLMDKVNQSPRLFRKKVKLGKNSFLPIDDNYRYERILDGWVSKIGL